ncbi:hypothetical protein [Flavobacterium sp. LM5]|uniref:hypothetical protein n=1 Tax=Flavobacterium sp. LM5 TaxID=1938610 RepID=UPI000993D42B|nr:hypothetical protein [Flavobacterium sp. LM5]
MRRPILLLLLLIGCILSCQKEPTPPKVQSFYQEKITPDDVKTLTTEEAKTYHRDTVYDYEYRTGTSGHYEYQYQVHGRNEAKDSINGLINIKGKYGAGILIDNNQDTLAVEVEWVAYGVLKGKDQQGRCYELRVH